MTSRDFHELIDQSAEKTKLVEEINEKIVYLDLSDRHAAVARLSDSIINEMSKKWGDGLTEKDSIELRIAMLKLVAYLKLSRRVEMPARREREIIRKLCFCCHKSFSRATISAAIECWSWLISARPDLTPVVLGM